MKYMLFTYRDPDVQLDTEQRAAIPPAVAGLHACHYRTYHLQACRSLESYLQPPHQD